ncbi:hypothetical protein GCM10010967_12760 [Dyadobacter beijingensis]|uniref:Uncharacterized protein n=1 Tax=Dyadobacter beijingensis TaxID=365489 RepID=A0ABQ2HI45_9BACT|nr:hypothetical protein GCM10010967_12760 [Dyadobacter beijingensis]
MLIYIKKHRKLYFQPSENLGGAQKRKYNNKWLSEKQGTYTMPFIIRSSQAKQLGILDWDEIDIGIIYKYRKEFKSPHNKLRDRGLDFTNETKSVAIDALRFNELIQSAEVGHYLDA